MSIISWILLGLLSAFIANKIMDKSGQGFLLDVALGVLGALIAGFVFSRVGGQGLADFNLWSAVASLIGATVVLGVHHAVSDAPA